MYDSEVMCRQKVDTLWSIYRDFTAVISLIHSLPFIHSLWPGLDIENVVTTKAKLIEYIQYKITSFVCTFHFTTSPILLSLLENMSFISFCSLLIVLSKYVIIFENITRINIFWKVRRKSDANIHVFLYKLLQYLEISLFFVF